MDSYQSEAIVMLASGQENMTHEKKKTKKKQKQKAKWAA